MAKKNGSWQIVSTHESEWDLVVRVSLGSRRKTIPTGAVDYFDRGFERYGNGKGDLDGAIADYNKAIEINPQDISSI